MTRKPPIRHTVKSHTREGKVVKGFVRGAERPKSKKTPRLIKKKEELPYEIRTYKHHGSWYAYAVDVNGDQIGDAKFAHQKSMAVRYLKEAMVGVPIPKRKVTVSRLGGCTVVTFNTEGEAQKNYWELCSLSGGSVKGEKVWVKGAGDYVVMNILGKLRVKDYEVIPEYFNPEELK